jgi:hypothetical protein
MLQIQMRSAIERARHETAMRIIDNMSGRRYNPSTGRYE